MSSPNPQPPKSGLGQSLRHLFKDGARAVHEWHEQAEAERKRAIANAKFPLFQVMRLFGLNVCLGILPTLTQGTWATVAWIAIIGISVYCILLAFDPYEYYLAEPNLISSIILFGLSIILVGLSRPWALTAEKLNLVLHRWILGTVRHECLREFLVEGIPTFCFIALVGLNGAGLWVGHWVGTQFL